ncbi:MAG: lysophospholipid acyltransferase family protein [Alistipes sp.]|nr:lysophospholipid acyltransferase family protein [Alistipes sp.]
MAEHREDSALRWYHKIGLELLWAWCRVVYYAPRWFRFYVVSPFFYAVLSLVRYRRGVILNNIRNSFPEYSAAECRRLMRRYYKMLAEVIVCTMSLAGAKPERDGDIMIWEDAEKHIERMRGRDWVAMAAHFGCWEYFLLWCWRDTESRFLGVYHPLRSTIFEHFYRRLRALAPNIVQTPMKETLRLYLRNRAEGRGVVLGLISDQSPILRADLGWYKFLNQDTVFVEGGEKFASRFHIPLYFVHVRRIAAGRYAARFEELYDGVEEFAPGELTRRYARALESMIREAPELWMWSHKRWKHTPEKQAAKFGIEKKVAK